MSPQVEQSAGQVAQLSVRPQTWSPQTSAQLPQSSGQVTHRSYGPQYPSPHHEQTPQSGRQVVQNSG
jgi:hypothetical protein